MNPSPNPQANPSPTPPMGYAPNTGNPLLRALTGPFLLTTLGVLLTIDYMGGINFGRTWPVLLIVMGLCKAAEYFGPRPA